MKTVTDALDVVGFLLLAVGLALGVGLAVAAATAPVWGWPAGLLTLGGAIMVVSWVLDYLTGDAPDDDESGTE